MCMIDASGNDFTFNVSCYMAYMSVFILFDNIPRVSVQFLKIGLLLFAYVSSLFPYLLDALYMYTLFNEYCIVSV